MWTPGIRAGDAQTVQATLGSLAVTFTATAVPGPPALLETVDGNAQTAYAREALADTLVVAVTDRFTNPTPAVPVTWSVVDGGGALTSLATTTDASAGFGLSG